MITNMNKSTTGFQNISCQFEPFSKYVNILSELYLFSLFYDALGHLQISMHW